VNPPIDIVGNLLALMWVCLAAVILIYAQRQIAAGQRLTLGIVAVAGVAFAAGYLAHRIPRPTGAVPPSAARFAQTDLSRISLESAPAIGSIDRLEARMPRFIDVAGWVADGVRYRAGGGIFLLVDGVRRVRANVGYYGGERPDVARVFKDANLLWTGYGVRYVPAALAPGPHYMQIAVVSENLRHAYVLGQRVTFVLVPGAVLK
jgi:hypothetical protein